MLQRFIYLNEISWILIYISLKYVHKGPINDMSALDQIMAWHPADDNALPETMVY